MKLKIGYIIKNIHTRNYIIIVPIWKKNFKYNKIQLNTQKNYLYDNRTELLDNFSVLVKFNPKKKQNNLIKILN